MIPSRSNRHRLLMSAAVLIVIGIIGQPARSDTVLAAVASNFTAPMKDIAQRFEQTTGHTVTLAFGSSGKLFAQIRHGAPFDVFLSADQEKPHKLIEAGLAEDGSQSTYALGRLALWSAKPNINPLQTLKSGAFTRLALANPRLAPYGEAATRTLASLGMEQSTRSKQVTGENISQTWQFVSTGNAQLGFVALSQILSNGQLTRGSVWVIPPEHYQPVKQDAVLLSRSQHNPAAMALLDFLHQEETATILQQYGYDLPTSETPPGALTVDH